VVAARWDKLRGPNREEKMDLAARRLTQHYSTAEQIDAIQKLCHSQLWPGLEIKENVQIDGKPAGRGVLAVVEYEPNDIICNYHGHEIEEEVADGYYNATDPSDRRSDYMLKLPNRNGVHIDSHKERCDCHEDMRTIGRLFNYAHWGSTECNMKIKHYDFPKFGTYGGLFIANRKIERMEELRWDYGDPNCRRMFSSEITQ
jgi:hypothetical protein